MAAEDLLVHDGGHGETVETVGEGFPQLDIVSPLTYHHLHFIFYHFISVRKVPLTFVVESINSVDGCTLMVAT